MAKQFGYTASILKNSNRLVASSQADWGTLRNGSYVILEGDEHFYTVIGKNKFFYIKDVTVASPAELVIDDNVGINVTMNDVIAFSYKKYEVDSVSIAAAGKSYKQGDLLRPEGGVCSYSAIDDIDTPTELEVAEVGAQGEIKALTIKSKGVYIEAPAERTRLVSGAGDSAEVVLNVTLLDSRSIEERSVKSIRIDGENNKTHLELNNSLPPKLIKGKISINKWEILLNINHPGENRINTTYQVIRDFTPNLNIPLMKGNISKNEAVYNEAISKIDEAIKKLYDKTELDL